MGSSDMVAFLTGLPGGILAVGLVAGGILASLFGRIGLAILLGIGAIALIALQFGWF